MESVSATWRAKTLTQTRDAIPDPDPDEEDGVEPEHPDSQVPETQIAHDIVAVNDHLAQVPLDPTQGIFQSDTLSKAWDVLVSLP